MWLRKVTHLWCDSEVKFLSNDYTNPNTNPKTFTTLTLTLTDPQNAFERFCVPVYCDFIRNYLGTHVGSLVTSFFIILLHMILIRDYFASIYKSGFVVLHYLWTGLRELPYWSHYSKPRLLLHTVVCSKYFDLSIAGVIGLNVITMALEFYMMPQVSKSVLGACKSPQFKQNPHHFVPLMSG